ncbi:Fe-S protein assembly co-chaperone HscB [Chromobacterium violaceum]|uniref:Co-chaperone protein HscB homolog n=2 Tax=Chromobacterium violaceum TaxID=536 RepID=HSCB_CHRVO|nr:Fe-S protein assembly co-chaperone HscB [Chromobacterium violaceum]Q7NZ31.2 RecName: Full=Co-chaperone protein HscB homolog [Chromobacterium violaceum ATCC 12472]OVE48787.1 co-chaperone protein HscB [Chromobacterium violaceum]SUX39667.1 Co-chaperone protein hscB homolog [Chromobacterium violaceum]
MNHDFNQDFFSLFGLPRRFAIDAAGLDAAWRAAAAQVHPDRYAASSDADKRSALMLATRVNEGYQTLKSPLNRARYLLQLSGVDTQEENNTRMPADFLMAQMEWRESIDDARADVDALESLSRRLRGEVRDLQTELEAALDARADLDAAAVLVRKLRFMEKLDQEIGDAIESLLD